MSKEQKKIKDQLLILPPHSKIEIGILEILNDKKRSEKNANKLFA
jgi:hypothetical protein